MPDQYGNPRPGRDEPTQLDNPGPPPDYAATAKRGMNLIRQTMGWHRDETRDETPPPPTNALTHPQKPAKTQHSANKPPPNTHPPPPKHQPTQPHNPHTQHPPQPKSQNMPPVMDRKSSRARAENAWRLRVRGRLWREIAEELGYRSPRSAQKAVEDFLARTPPTDAETLRRAMGDGLTMIRQKLLDALDAAEEAGDHQAVATLGRAAADTIEKQAKLAGLHIAIPQQIELNVRSAAAVLERAEQELLAIAQQPQSEIVDAEVVE